MAAYEISRRPDESLAPVFRLSVYDYHSLLAPERALQHNEQRIRDSPEFDAILDWLHENPDELVRLEVEHERSYADPAQAARFIIDRDNRARVADALDRDAELPDPDELRCAIDYFGAPQLASWLDVEAAMDWYDLSLAIIIHAANGHQTIQDVFDERVA